MSKRKETDVTDKFRPSFSIKDFKFTDKQRTLIRLIRNEDNKVIFIKGCAGTGKTLLSIFCGLMAIRDGSKDKLIYIRPTVESCQTKLGYLPGDVAQKSSPFCIALQDKLDELLDYGASHKLVHDEIIQSIPPNFLRGVTFRNQFVVVDESQNLCRKDLITALTRIGENCTLIFCGDTMQSDIRNSGFQDIIDVFNDQESKDQGIQSFEFGSEDVMRSAILRFIMSKLE